MSDDAYGATIAKRRLSRVLTRLRVEAGLTANQVCDRLNWGRGKVGRFEANQWKRPEMSDVRDLLRLYGVPTDNGQQQTLEDTAVLARTRGWWRDYSDVFTNEFPGYEADASRISVYTPLVLPGLLQTRAYIQSQLSIGPHPPAWQERALQARLRRQKILDRTDGTAPTLRAVITEASLLYRWGTDTDRRDQIDHLIALSQRPHIELRILRFADGPHPGMSSLISLFDFPHPEDDSIVYFEDDITIHEVDNQVDTHSDMFEKIRSAAIDPTAFAALLHDIKNGTYDLQH